MSKKQQKQYKVIQQIAGANVLGGIFLPGRIITRDDLPAKAEWKFKKLVDDGWLEEVKDDGEIQTE